MGHRGPLTVRPLTNLLTALMDLITQYLPITAFVAIVVFFLKEFLEFLRKRRERKRKIGAMKILLSEEIEKNHWAFKQMFSALDSLKETREASPEARFRLLVTRDGHEHFRVRKEQDGAFESGHPIPKFVFSMYEKLLPSLAELDSKLFEATKGAYEELIELAHFRNILVDYLAGGEDMHDREATEDFLAGFADEQPEYFKQIEAGYLKLAGKALNTWKLR